MPDGAVPATGFRHLTTFTALRHSHCSSDWPQVAEDKEDFDFLCCSDLTPDNIRDETKNLRNNGLSLARLSKGPANRQTFCKSRTCYIRRTYSIDQLRKRIAVTPSCGARSKHNRESSNDDFSPIPDSDSFVQVIKPTESS